MALHKVPAKAEALHEVRHAVIKMASSATVPAFPKVKSASAGWVTFGLKNLFPTELINMNSKSPVNAAIIRSKVTYITGKGFKRKKEEDTEQTDSDFLSAPNVKESWETFFNKLATDYENFGGFYYQVILNKDSKTVSLFHVDYSTVRIGETDETGAVLGWYISNDWTKTSGKNKPVPVDAFTSLSALKAGDKALYHHWDYAPGLTHYSVPPYFEALEYVKADGALGVFYNNSIENNFAPSVVISMPSNPSKEEKDRFQLDMEDAFSGPDASTSVVVLWGEDKVVKPEITPFNASANADIYNSVEKIVFQKIISSHQLSSPTLAGVSGSGNLSGNASEIVDAFILFNYTVIEKRRRTLLESLNKVMRHNSVGAVLEVEELDVVAKIRESEKKTETFTIQK